MSALYFIVGFFHQLFFGTLTIIPISIDVGSAMMRKKAFVWDLTSEEFFDALEEEYYDGNGLL